jgi:cell division protein FtsZ
VDFADVRTIMCKQGRALMGAGVGSGKRRAGDAAEMAISSPLLEDVNIEGATGILINITGGPDLGLHEVNEASSLIQQAAHEEANIIFGSVIDPGIGDEVRITVIATGFERPAPAREKPVPTRGAPAKSERGSQIALPYDQSQAITREYPPPMAQRPARPTDPGGYAPTYYAQAHPAHPTHPAHAHQQVLTSAQPYPQPQPYPYPAPHQQHPTYVPAHHLSAPPVRYESRRVVMRHEEEDVPIHESEVDTALSELSREPYAEMTIEQPRFAHGSGPTPAYENSAQHHHAAQAQGQGEPRRKVEFPKVHPSLRHVLAEVEVDSELDVPTFLRRANE